MTHDNGGPAYPMPSGPEPRHNETTHYNEGMTLLDHFAGLAMQAMASFGTTEDIAKAAKEYAEASYTLAEAMIAEKRRLEANA